MSRKRVEEAANDYFRERQKEVAAVAAEHGLPIACETRRGHPAKALVNLADEGGYDLIVVGHSDHSELWGWLLGDIADRISDHAHCSVLIIKQSLQFFSPPDSRNLEPHPMTTIRKSPHSKSWTREATRP